MKRELNHFTVDQHYYGGSQDWMLDPWMKLGGCAALAAVDSCIYFANEFRLKKLCPVDPRKLTKNTYRSFASLMKPYLRPRAGGVSRLNLYTEGFSRYIKERNMDSVLQMCAFSMGCPLDEAQKNIKDQIDQGFLIPMLLLNPVSHEARGYHWHWFLINGYEEKENEFFVKLTTYAAWEWMDLKYLWDTNRSSNGGLILYELKNKD